jgi:hypothetical protein
MPKTYNVQAEVSNGYNELGASEFQIPNNDDPVQGAHDQTDEAFDVDPGAWPADPPDQREVDHDSDRDLLDAIACGADVGPVCDYEQGHLTVADAESSPAREKADDEDHNLTDTGNGRRLVDKHQDELRFCVDDRCWYLCDGVRWHKDDVQRIRELAKDIAADLCSEAETMRKPARTQDKDALARYETRKLSVLNWANQSEGADRVTKMVRSAPPSRTPRSSASDLISTGTQTC